MNTILGLEEKVPSYIEKEVVCAPAQLRVFEAEFDDLCEAERLLDNYWDQHETQIEGNAEFKKEMETFQDKLSGVKQTYEDFISLVLDRFSDIHLFPDSVILPISLHFVFETPFCSLTLRCQPIAVHSDNLLLVFNTRCRREDEFGRWRFSCNTSLVLR